MNVKILLILITLFIQGCSLISINQKEYHSDKPVVMFILDTSGSMREQDSGSGQTRISDAKKSLIKTVSQLDRNRYNASLVTFGESKKWFFTNKCGVKVAVEPSNNLDEIVNITKSVKADGRTPLAKSIKISGEILKNVDKKMIILLTDGLETCGGNPVTEAKQLHEKDININFQIIGYAVDANTRRELEKISRISADWNYYDAKDSIELEKVIDDITRETKSPCWESANKCTFEFDTESAHFKEKYLFSINEIYDYLRYNDKHIKVIGHTDSRGTSAYNLALSKKRANAVKDKLIDLGIDQNRITIEGRGEDEPKENNSTQEGRKANRRVEILIK